MEEEVSSSGSGSSAEDDGELSVSGQRRLTKSERRRLRKEKESELRRVRRRGKVKQHRHEVAASRREMLSAMTLEERRAFIRAERAAAEAAEERLQKRLTDNLHSGKLKVAVALNFMEHMRAQEYMSLAKQIQWIWNTVKANDSYSVKIFLAPFTEDFRDNYCAKFGLNNWIINTHPNLNIHDWMQQCKLQNDFAAAQSAAQPATPTEGHPEVAASEAFESAGGSVADGGSAAAEPATSETIPESGKLKTEAVRTGSARKFEKPTPLRNPFTDVQRVIFLSPDAPDLLTLEDLRGGSEGQNEAAVDATLFIIGGLVDRTVQKNASLELCQKWGFESRRLPIHESVGTKVHPVLNLNTVVDILGSIKFDGLSFSDAILKHVPTRKQQSAELGRTARRAAAEQKLRTEGFSRAPATATPAAAHASSNIEIIDHGNPLL